jgi:hypothetical protein
MPHPSPRNRLWLRKNPWFEEEVVPYLQERIRELLPARVRLPRALPASSRAVASTGGSARKARHA